MNKLFRLKNKSIARLVDLSPKLAKFLTASYKPIESANIPWTPVTKRLSESKIGIATTAGIHHSEQKPFDMFDRMGDPTYREIDTATIEKDFRITHDYYDHRDARTDLNIVFPVTRLKEMAKAGLVGSVSDHHFSFMGHIDKQNIDKLIKHHAPEVAVNFSQNRVDAVILTPG